MIWVNVADIFKDMGKKAFAIGGSLWVFSHFSRMFGLDPLLNTIWQKGSRKGTWLKLC